MDHYIYVQIMAKKAISSTKYPYYHLDNIVNRTTHQQAHITNEDVVTNWTHWWYSSSSSIDCDCRLLFP